MQLKPTQSAAVRRSVTGFTLVEILVVVLILGILAAIVVPQFTSAAGETRENSAKMNLFRIRQQIELYKQQHNGDWPSLEKFSDQLTMASNAAGETAEPGTSGYPYGPYLRDVPVNPFTSKNEVSDEPVGSDKGWYYDEDTGAFHPNDSAAHREY